MSLIVRKEFIRKKRDMPDKKNVKAIAIGASAGALEAVTTLLEPLPADYPLPIIIVVHLPPDKDSIMARLLNDKCAITVKEAEDKEPIKPSHAYLAPPDYHLQIEKDYYFSLSIEDPILYSRPSIDVLFETAADAYRENLCGIVLTGANSDGANGLKAIMGYGGLGFVQEPKGAYASTMPKAAKKNCPKALVMPLSEIATTLLKL